jgi:uncharacterized metal-binding protein
VCAVVRPKQSRMRWFMPNGDFHRATTLIGAVVAPAGMITAGTDVGSSVAVGVGFLVGLVVHPDLDLNTRLPKKPVKLLWRLLWYPYSRLVPHRSRISHFPFFGTLIRAMYIGIPLFFLGSLIGVEVRTLPYIFLGLCLSDLLHIFFDTITTRRSNAVLRLSLSKMRKTSHVPSIRSRNPAYSMWVSRHSRRKNRVL